MVAQRELIDWLSFTVPNTANESSHVYDLAGIAHNSLVAHLGELWNVVLNMSGYGWEQRRGRSPYGVTFHNGYGVVVFVGAHVSTVLVEISGKGCDWVRQKGLMGDLLSLTKNRLSRIDIAVDYKTDLLPKDFVDAGYTNKFKSRGTVVSPDGKTEYIGSKKSERYCKVYRYNKPHPRWEYMRIEYTYKKLAAKKTAELILEHGIRKVAHGSAAKYQWKHDIIKDEVVDMDMSTYRPERRGGKTLRWIISQVAPAFKKLVKEGIIENPQEFLDTYFLND